MKTEECEKCVLYAKTFIIKRGDKRPCPIQISYFTSSCGVSWVEFSDTLGRRLSLIGINLCKTVTACHRIATTNIASPKQDTATRTVQYTVELQIFIRQGPE